MNIGDLVVDSDIVPHPLLGEAHLVCDRTGTPLTAMSVLDWARPTQIPTIAEPGALPPGAGALLLNAIAELAVRAGVVALRYAGPYPTPALYRALARSFRCAEDEATFTADVVARALRVARDELPIDFQPAPHMRVAFARGFSELRDGVERAVIDGIAFDRAGSPGRLVDLHAELWFGDAAWARVATLAPSGELVAGPWALPAITVPAAEFPPALRAALADLVADAVPAPLATDARTAVTARTLAWADLGGRVARRTPTGFEVHAALWERVAPLGLARLALALVEALAPVVTAALVAEIVEARGA